MRLTRLGTFSPRRLAWLLALVLLLPLTQAAANWHLVSHALADQSEQSSGDQGFHPNQCAVCLSAAGVTGGAIPPQSIAPPPITLPAEAPRIKSSSIWLALAQRPYESRAPPFALT